MRRVLTLVVFTLVLSCILTLTADYMDPKWTRADFFLLCIATFTGHVIFRDQKGGG